MSIEQYVYVGTPELPNVDQWLQEIEAAGFCLSLDPEVNLKSHSGFWPAKYRGKLTGFEFYYDGVFRLRELPHNAHVVRPSRFWIRFGFLLRPHGPDRLGLRSREPGWPVVSFRFGRYFSELVAATIAGAVLAKMTHGHYYEAESDTLWDGERAMEVAKQLACALESGSLQGSPIENAFHEE